MKLLLIHADYLEYKVTRKGKSEVIEDLKEKKAHIDDPLVVFTTVEKIDEYKRKSVERTAVENIINVAKQVKPRSIVLYPFAHFSRDLATAEASFHILKTIGNLLEEKGFSVYRVPFGWNKKVEIRSKGHPLAELSRVI